MDARTQILAGGRADRQCVWRQKSVLLLSAGRGVVGVAGVSSRVAKTTRVSPTCRHCPKGKKPYPKRSLVRNVNGRTHATPVCVRSFAVCAAQDDRLRESALAFRGEFGSRDNACWDKSQSSADSFLSRRRTGLMIFGVSVNLPEIVKLRVGQNIFDTQHRGHHGVILIVVFMHAVASDEMQVWITIVQFLTD